MTDATTDAGAPHRPALVAAAVLTGAALQLNNGFYTPFAVTLVVAALVLTWAALVAPRLLASLVPDRDPLVRGALFLGVQAQIVVLMRAPIGMYLSEPSPADHPSFVIGLIAASIATGVVTTAAGRLRHASALVLLGSATVLGVLTYRASPEPRIDVITVHDAAYEALARRESPYSITFRDIYGGREAFYPDGMVQDGVVQYGFPYPPLSLAMTWPGHRAGDFRLSELAAWVAAAALTIAAGRGSAVSVLAAALVLFTPRAFFGLEQAWTDPLAAVWLAAALAAAVGRRATVAAACVGLAAATKQHAVVAVPLLWLLADHDRRTFARLVLVAGATAAVALAPALGDVSGFLNSAVLVQVRENLRYDSLSVAVVYATTAGAPLPGAAYALLVIAAMGVAAWRAPRTPAGFAVALAAVLLTTFAFGKKAFCNYYLFALVTMGLAVATSRMAVRTGAAVEH